MNETHGWRLEMCARLGTWPHLLNDGDQVVVALTDAQADAIEPLLADARLGAAVRALRAKAEAACSPGPWYDEQAAVYDEATGGVVAGCNTDNATATFIAAANPATVLSLLDEIDGLRAQLEVQRHMHAAFRPEVVAEIAVQLSDDADWEEIARWCGGRIDGETLPSGDYASRMVVGGETAVEGMWVTLGHDGVFRVRHTIDGPEAADALAGAPTPAETVFRQRAQEAWVAYELAAIDHGGWPCTNEVTDAASVLIGTLPALFAATDRTEAQP
jgi:hypothetical protein